MHLGSFRINSAGITVSILFPPSSIPRIFIQMIRVIEKHDLPAVPKNECYNVNSIFERKFGAVIRRFQAAMKVTWLHVSVHLCKSSNRWLTVLMAVATISTPFYNVNWESNIRFEVLTAVVVKSTIFWDITPCSPVKVNRRGLLATCLLAGSCWNDFLRPWRWRRYVPPKRRLQLNRLHGVTPQKMILFISAFAWKQRKTKKPCVERAGRRTFRIHTDI
jgi:hypothetical protein